MGIPGRKPLLMTGMALCLLLGAWEGLHTHILAVGQWGLWGLTLLGLGIWSLKRPAKVASSSPLAPLSIETVSTAIAATQHCLETLAQDNPDLDLRDLALPNLAQSLERTTLTLGITGGKRTGKTAFKTLVESQAWSKNLGLTWLETEPLFLEKESLEPLQSLTQVDLIVFLTNGDLTDPEWQCLESLHRQYHQCLLLFNKQDQYSLSDRQEILQQLQHHWRTIAPQEDVLSMAAAPQPIAVRKHQMNGTVEEIWEQPNPDLGNLSQHLEHLIQSEKERLLLGTLWRKVQQIKITAQTRLNQIRRDRALPIIEQYQWLAAGTALINPIASVDLLATAAINGQMVLDLGKIYQQKLSLSQAGTVATTLAQLMVKLGLVELSTQALGSILKTQPLTYVAGGALQGISAAYLTRVAGLSLVEYMQEAEVNLNTNHGLNVEKLSQKIRQIFEQTQRYGWLQNFAQQTLKQVKGNASAKLGLSN